MRSKTTAPPSLTLKREQPPEALIFDLGGVIVDLEPRRTARSFAALGARVAFEAVWTPTSQAAYFVLHETGKLSDDAFRQALRQHLDLQASAAQIDAAWNAMLVGIPAARLALLEAAKHNYRIFALSNTNSIHVQYLNTLCPSDAGIATYFEQVYFSHRLGVRKPDAAAFDRVLQAHALVASRTLFIDDNLTNIAAAQKLGLRTHHHTPQCALSSVL